MSYINPSAKLFQHLDTLAAIKRGERPAPVNVEFFLSNRCSHGCVWCLTRTAILDILGRGKCSIADVRPGDCVLAYNEVTGMVQWSEVYAVSDRSASERIYTIVVGDKAIEATGNHRVYTRRGWVEARHLTISDEVAHVSEAMRVRLWSSREVERVKVLSRSWADSGSAQGQQRTHESQQSDATVRGIREATENMASEWAGRDCIAEDEGPSRERRTVCACEYAKPSSQVVAAHEGQQSHEGCWCGCQSQGDAREQGNQRANQRTLATTMEGPGVSAGARGSHEIEQSHVLYGDSRKESEQDAHPLGAVAVGAVVQPLLREIRISCPVHGNGRILGSGAQSRFQGPGDALANRSDGRLFAQARDTDHRELCVANDSALSSAWARVPGGDAAHATTEQDPPIAGGFGAGNAGLYGDGQEYGLEFQRIASISSHDMAVEVFNLETSTATYFANNLLVHNCHYAHTHTRGPLAGKVARPDGAISGGDLMDKDLAFSILRQLGLEGVKSVTWSGGGEPTLHPMFGIISRFALAFGLEQGIYTHGGHIDSGLAEYMKARFKWVYISLDECSADAFKASKGLDRFDAVLDGIKRLVDADGTATIGLGFLLHKGNHSQVQRMVRLGRELRVDYVQFRPTVLYQQDAPGELAEDTTWVTWAIGRLNEFANDPFVIADIERFKQYQRWTGHGYSTCHWSALQTVITPNGKVWRCTNKNEHPDALLGDLSVESFADVWARSGGACSVDSGCRVMCIGHQKNVILDQLMQPQVHSNFI